MKEIDVPETKSDETEKGEADPIETAEETTTTIAEDSGGGVVVAAGTAPPNGPKDKNW